MQFRGVVPRMLGGSASLRLQRRALCVRGCRVLLTSAGNRNDGGNTADAKSGEDLVKAQQQQEGVVWYALWRTPKGKALLTKLAAAYVAVLGLLWGVYALLPPCSGGDCSAAGGSEEDAVQKLRLGGHFTLTDHTGEVFSTKEKLDGKWWLVYFGFANCPTVCPAELTKITDTLHTLEKEKDLPSVQPLFVTLDPDRDTPAKMADFLTPFHKDFVGLTGEMATIEEVAKKFRVYYSVVCVPGGGVLFF